MSHILWTFWYVLWRKKNILFFIFSYIRFPYASISLREIIQSKNHNFCCFNLGGPNINTKIIKSNLSRTGVLMWPRSSSWFDIFWRKFLRWIQYRKKCSFVFLLFLLRLLTVTFFLDLKHLLTWFLVSDI